MYNLLPYATLEAAIDGDMEAVLSVLSHYERYMSTLASRYGHYDVEAMCRMESKLTQALLKFRLE